MTINGNGYTERSYIVILDRFPYNIKQQFFGINENKTMKKEPKYITRLDVLDAIHDTSGRDYSFLLQLTQEVMTT